MSKESIQDFAETVIKLGSELSPEEVIADVGTMTMITSLLEQAAQQ